jgi:Flp pilus assembly protein TadG
MANTRAAGRPGTTATELALVLPLLMLLALACVDFGRVAYLHIALNGAARAGAAHAIMNPDIAAGSGNWQEEIQQKAREEMEQQTGYDPDRLTTTATLTLEPTGLRRVRVEATYASFEPLVPWPGIPAQLTLVRAVEMRCIR